MLQDSPARMIYVNIVALQKLGNGLCRIVVVPFACQIASYAFKSRLIRDVDITYLRTISKGIWLLQGFGCT